MCSTVCANLGTCKRRVLQLDGTARMQACYGHTEGAAGLTGALYALGALAQAQAPGIMCLRDVNPYVSSALHDWGASMPPFAPRQTAPGPVRDAALSSACLVLSVMALGSMLGLHSLQASVLWLCCVQCKHRVGLAARWTIPRAPQTLQH